MKFEGTERFAVIREVARGGMGVVYEAYDRTRGMRVAIKLLYRLKAAHLWRFKREFRILSNLYHPNIVGLYELFSIDKQWFFTMEFIHGQEVLAYVQKQHDDDDAHPLQQHDNDTLVGLPPTLLGAQVVEDVELRPSSERISTVDVLRYSSLQKRTKPFITEAIAITDIVAEFDASETRNLRDVHRIVHLDRMEDVLRQLAQAIARLHSIGVVHCDIKPSNVLVTHEGRVVLIDFGIATTLSVDTVNGIRLDSENSFEGTPMFMAPEQIRREAPTPATDWYAFGILVYYMLTGQVPFAGGLADMLVGKQEHDPPSPHTLSDNIPSHYADLCMRLLARDPTERPDADAIFTALGISRSPQRDNNGPRLTVGRASTFVGREQELATIYSAFGAARANHSRCILLSGSSGMGKTSLVEEALHALQKSDNASPIAHSSSRSPLILNGWCSPHERVAYNAFDSVIDHLCQAMLDLPATACSLLMPSDSPLLARLFPVLQQLPKCAHTPMLANSLELRRHAIEALRELLCKLADTRPIIIRIEDLQWGDPNSFDLLRTLLQPEPQAAILFICTFNTDKFDPADDTPVADFLRWAKPQKSIHHLTLGPLSENAQIELTDRLSYSSARTPSVSPEWKLAIRAEANGHPMLLAELMRYADRNRDITASSLPTLGDSLWERYCQQSDVTRKLIAATAVMGEAAPMHLLGKIAAVPPAEQRPAVQEAINAHLLRSNQIDPKEYLDVAHNKVRTTIVERLPAASVRSLHRLIALAIEEWDDSANLALAVHWLAAGDHMRSAERLLRVADSASEQLAFEQAAELYQRVEILLNQARHSSSSEGDDRHIEQLRCRSWLGQASNLWFQQHGRRAMMFLDKAHRVAERSNDIVNLAEIHAMRGKLVSVTGDSDACLTENQKAYEHAVKAGLAHIQGDALCGLGDAYLIKGYMRTACEYFESSLEFARFHRLEGLEAKSIARRSITRLFELDLFGALQDATDAVALATRIGDIRTKLYSTSLCMAPLWCELGSFDDAQTLLKRTLKKTQRLGISRFEAHTLLFLGRLCEFQGNLGDARAWLAMSWVIVRDTSRQFIGPMTLSSLARVTDNDVQRQFYLTEAKEILQSPCLSINHFYFYRDVIDISLAENDYESVERNAAALADYTREQPLPWSRFFVDRAMALSDYYRGERDHDVIEKLVRLSRMAHSNGLYIAVREIDAALEQHRAQESG